MVRFLPFILIPVLIIAGLLVWRFGITKQSLSTTETTQQVQDSAPNEVPKTLPKASLEDRVNNLETLVTKLTPQANSLTIPASSTQPSSLDSRVANLESAITDLRARVSALEKATPATTASQPTIYIPMGSAAGPWSSTDWSTLNEYEISLDPGNYPGYSGMNLEVNFRLVDPSGTGSVRLYNSTDSSVISSQLDTVSTGFSVKTSVSFKLTSGQKTYKLQVKSSGSKELYIQSARIKVNF